MNKITSFFGTHQENDHFQSINLDAIKPNPFQPRKRFDHESLQDLTDSIKQYGVLQPILLRKITNQEYQLIAGERRFRASKIAGLTEIPSIIMEMDDQQAAEIVIIENLQRENLNYFEEAEAFKQLTDLFNLTQDEVAKKVGKSQSTIANKLRLLRISETVRNQISVEVITERHLRSLLQLKNPSDQLFVLEKIYQKNLNVKQTDVMVKNILSEKNNNITVSSTQSPTKYDYRIFKNTLKKSLEAIEYGGAKTEYKEKINNDHMEVTIKIYPLNDKVKKQKNNTII